MRPSDWETMPFFLAVARGGSLRAGAATMNASHVTVNRNIQILETSYGVQLFTRSRRGFQLTTAGEALMPLAEEAERIFLGARRRVDGLDRSETGTIRFSLSPMMAYDVVAPILARFFTTYPEIDIEFRLTDRKEDINRAETDVSLRVAYEVTDDVVARKLYPIAIGTYASRNYLENVVSRAEPGGAGLCWIGWTGPGNDTSLLSQSPFPLATVRHASDEGYMHLSLVRQGCGLSKLPVIYEHLYPDLYQVPGTETELSRTMWILLHTDLRRTVRVRRFVDFLADGLRELQPHMQGALYRG